MSGAALGDSSWKMDIPDDLESLFYVMLWHAIKYLPHNCANVGGLLYKLFDEAEWNGSKCAGGTNKRLAMADGCIFFTGADGKPVKLSFHLKTDPRNPHLINDIIQGIISLFGQYYKRKGDTTTSIVNPALSDFLAEIGAASMNQETLMQLRRRANHDYFERLFNIYLDNLQAQWPRNDKIADQVPKNYEYDRNQKYPAALPVGILPSGVKSGIKRPHPPQDDTEPTAGPGPTTVANGISRERRDSNGPFKRQQSSNDGVVEDRIRSLSRL